MKIVYEDSVIDQIRKAQDDAIMRGKRIKHVELTDAEWKEVSRYFDPPLVQGYFGSFFTYNLLGVEIRKAP